MRTRYSRRGFAGAVLPVVAIAIFSSIQPVLFAAADKTFDLLHAADTKHTDIFSKYSHAVVGISCRGTMRGATEGAFTGTGAVVSPDGWILSSITTIPKDAHDIKVFFTDGHVRSATLKST